MKKEFVRCIDCGHAGEMKTADGIVARCGIFKVGKVKRAKRRCDHFYPKKQIEQK